jgi:hypothetical protein
MITGAFSYGDPFAHFASVDAIFGFSFGRPEKSHSMTGSGVGFSPPKTTT